METQVYWDNEVVAYNDEQIELLEAQIASEKALLQSLSREDEDDLF